MNESHWQACENPNEMLEFLRPWASERGLRLFACACCRDIWDWLEHDYERDAVRVAEQFADGKCSVLELLDANGKSSRHIPPRNDNVAIDTYWTSLACVVTHGDAWDSAYCVDFRTTFMLWHERESIRKRHCEILRDIFGNPFECPSYAKKSFAPHVKEIARLIYDDYEFDQLASLATSLAKSGADDQVIEHCRATTPHYRGCWAVDLILGHDVSFGVL